MDIKTLKEYKKSLPKDKQEEFDMYDFLRKEQEISKKLDSQINHEKLDKLKLERKLLIEKMNKNG